jgi:hypothetical protein
MHVHAQGEKGIHAHVAAWERLDPVVTSRYEYVRAALQIDGSTANNRCVPAVCPAYGTAGSGGQSASLLHLRRAPKGQSALLCLPARLTTLALGRVSAFRPFADQM